MCSPPALNFPFAVVQRQRSEADSRAKLFSVGGIMIKAIVGFAAIVALIETQALAADMALKAPPIPPQIYNWSGCHVGGTVGGAVGRSTYSGTPTGDFLTVEPSIIPNLSAITTGALNPSSVIGGGDIGCDWQINSVVIGFEGDFSGWNLSKSSALTGPGDPLAPGTTTLTAATSESSHWLATVRPRVGVARDNWLFYITGGVAFTSATFSQSVLFSASPSTMAGSVTSTLTGWTAGAGVEYGFTSNWLLKAEYLYVGFPSQNLNESNPAFPTFTATAANRLSASIFRLGLDYKFGVPGVLSY
jgi:outer membrane immunogenic protein